MEIIVNCHNNGVLILIYEHQLYIITNLDNYMSLFIYWSNDTIFRTFFIIPYNWQIFANRIPVYVFLWVKKELGWHYNGLYEKFRNYEEPWTIRKLYTWEKILYFYLLIPSGKLYNLCIQNLAELIKLWNMWNIKYILVSSTV